MSIRVIRRIQNALVKSPRLQCLARWLILYVCAPLLRLSKFGNRRRKAVLYVGQAYYINWYLSRALRDLGWAADLMNWDLNPESQIYYHGEDYLIEYKTNSDLKNFFIFFFNAACRYDIFHFANKGGLQFGEPMRATLSWHLGVDGFEIYFLKALGKKIVYSNNGCLDGVSQSAFSRWGPESICSICRWQNEPTVCSDERNLAWGEFRNKTVDYQCLVGGNRIDYNCDARVHEVPEYYCLDKNLWHPEIDIPERFRLADLAPYAVRLYHAVGNRAERTRNYGVNIKSSHVYLPLVERLRAEGCQLELIEPTGIPNKEVRYLQAQSDIFLDMLTYGWFGANAREGMMLGKPVICYLRPEWLDSARLEIPEYIAELPIISATPHTVEAILRDLITNKEKRLEIGRRSREFAVKWHSAEAGARRFNRIYGELLGLRT
jgi:glycosyltransferase involved in cell wall biosynthesis